MDTVMAKLERFLGETIDTSVGEYELENGNSAMSESTEEMTSMSVVLGGIAGIALLVGGIGIMNIMLVTVTERTREIGIKKSIGAPRREIVGQFLVEAAILSALGGLIGIALGLPGDTSLGATDHVATRTGIGSGGDLCGLKCLSSRGHAGPRAYQGERHSQGTGQLLEHRGQWMALAHGSLGQSRQGGS